MSRRLLSEKKYRVLRRALELYEATAQTNLDALARAKGKKERTIRAMWRQDLKLVKQMLQEFSVLEKKDTLSPAGRGRG